jgi:anti-sigma factor (TIGR02949 family)
MKLSCQQVLEELNSYVDREASADLRRAIELHLERCPRCWVVYDTTARTLRIVTEAEPFEVPLEVSARLYQRLAQVFSQPPPRSRET